MNMASDAVKRAAALVRATSVWGNLKEGSLNFMGAAMWIAGYSLTRSSGLPHAFEVVGKGVGRPGGNAGTGDNSGASSVMTLPLATRAKV